MTNRIKTYDWVVEEEEKKNIKEVPFVLADAKDDLDFLYRRACFDFADDDWHPHRIADIVESPSFLEMSDNYHWASGQDSIFFGGLPPNDTANNIRTKGRILRQSVDTIFMRVMNARSHIGKYRSICSEEFSN